VFKVDTSGNETVLHSFTNTPDGAGPFTGRLVMDEEGNLYGTTVNGGDLTCNSGYGCGVVFKLDTTGKEIVLHSFTNTPDGANPQAGVIMDKRGDLYGATSGGGAYGYGTVFKVNCHRNVEMHHCEGHSGQ
jgi:uncharacterized repeat protein (TIGR03803 family)